MNKISIAIEHNGRRWLVGGYWSAGDRFPKRPRNLKKLTLEEGFDPSRSAIVWLQEEKQVGFFVANESGKVPSGFPLGAQAIRHLTQQLVPWQGVFNLGGGIWWCVVSDSTGALHPLWDIAGSKEEVFHAINERAADLAQIRTRDTFETPEQSWNWLLRDDVVLPPKVVPVQRVKIISRRITVVLLLVALAFSASVAWMSWQRRQHLVEAQKRESERIAQSVAMQQKLHHDIESVRRSWQAIVPPWKQASSWREVVDRCMIGKVSSDGWIVESVQCVVSNGRMNIVRTLKRGPHATVLRVQPGKLSNDGNTLTQEEWVQLTTREAAGTPPSVKDASRLWLGLSQKWAGILEINASAAQPFVPEYPPGTSQDIRSKIPQPVLWSSIPVVITGSIYPASWTMLDTSHFLPVDMKIVLSGSRVSYTLRGMQYAQPSS